MKKSKNPNCHCDGSGYWKNPFDQEFKCACNKKKKSKAKGLTEKQNIEAVIRARLPMFLMTAWGKYEDCFGQPPHGTFKQMGALIEFGVVERLSEYLMRAKAARGGKK